MKVRRLLAVAALGVVLATTGCANGGYTTSGGKINVVTVDLPDGGTVVCVNIESSVDCDWDGVTR